MSTVAIGSRPVATADGTTIGAAKRTATAGVGAGVGVIIECVDGGHGHGGHGQGGEGGEMHCWEEAVEATCANLVSCVEEVLWMLELILSVDGNEKEMVDADDPFILKGWVLASLKQGDSSILTAI